MLKSTNILHLTAPGVFEGAMKNNSASVYMYFAHAVDTDLGTKPQKFSWQKKKRLTEK